MFIRSCFKLLRDKDRYRQKAIFGAKTVQKRCSFLAVAENLTVSLPFLYRFSLPIFVFPRKSSLSSDQR